MNSSYEDVVTQISGACVPVFTATDPLEMDGLQVQVYPNPFVTSTTISFQNPSGQSFDLEIVDLNGKVVRSLSGIRGEQVVIERGDLPSGLFLFRLMGPQNHTGKLMLF